MTYTSPVIYPTQVQWVGIGLETVAYGTAASAPTYWVPVVAPKWKPNQTVLKDDAVRGDMATLHGQVAGVRYDTLDYQCYLAIDDVFQHMRAIYGSTDTLTGSSDPYTHVTSLLNTGTWQPNSSTLWYFDGAECWQIAGAQLIQLDIETKVTEKGNATASWMGLPATKVSAPSNTPSTKSVWPSWNTTLTIGGNATTNYSDAKLTFKRDGASAEFGLAGTQAPYVIFVGGLSVTGSITAIYQGYTATQSDMANYLGNTQPTLVLQVNPVGDSTHYGKWSFTTVAYDDSTVQEGAKFMELASTIESVASSTDATSGGASPGKFTLLTAVSTSY